MARKTKKTVITSEHLPNIINAIAVSGITGGLIYGAFHMFNKVKRR